MSFGKLSSKQISQQQQRAKKNKVNGEIWEIVREKSRFYLKKKKMNNMLSWSHGAP